MRKTIWLVCILALNSCASRPPSCWPDLIESHNDIYYAFDKIEFDLNEIRSARSNLQETLYKCTDSDSFLASPDEVRIGNEVSISLLDIAVMADDVDRMKTYIDRIPLGEFDAFDESGLLYGGQYLHLGAYYESRKAVHELLILGTDPNTADDSGLTALHVANVATIDGLEVLRDLVSFGANINYKTRQGITPVMSARLHGDLAKAQCLISLGAAPPRISDFKGLSVDIFSKTSVATVDDFLFSDVRSVPSDISEICKVTQPN